MMNPIAAVAAIATAAITPLNFILTSFALRSEFIETGIQQLKAEPKIQPACAAIPTFFRAMFQIQLASGTAPPGWKINIACIADVADTKTRRINPPEPAQHPATATRLSPD
jgi:hypothetical protein